MRGLHLISFIINKGWHVRRDEWDEGAQVVLGWLVCLLAAGWYDMAW